MLMTICWMSRSLAGLLAPSAAAGLHQRLAQILELLMLRMQRLEIGVGCRQDGDLGEHDLRVADGRLLVEDLA